MLEDSNSLKMDIVAELNQLLFNGHIDTTSFNRLIFLH